MSVLSPLPMSPRFESQAVQEPRYERSLGLRVGDKINAHGGSDEIVITAFYVDEFGATQVEYEPRSDLLSQQALPIGTRMSSAEFILAGLNDGSWQRVVR